MNSDVFFKTLMKARRLAWLVGVLYVMGCVVLGLEFDPTNRNQWLIAASLGMVVAVTWLIYPLVLKFRNYRTNITEERLLGHVDKSLGIRKVYPNGMPRKFLRDHLVRSDIKSVKILANSARSYLIHYAAEAWPSLLASRDVKIQILIATEESEFVREAAKMESIIGLLTNNARNDQVERSTVFLKNGLEFQDRECSGKTTHCKSYAQSSHSSRNDPISYAITEVKQFLVEQAKKSNRRDFLEVRQFHTQIRANMVIIDDTWCCYTPHLPPVSPLNSFTLELTVPEMKQSKSLLRACLDYFQVVWDETADNKVKDL